MLPNLPIARTYLVAESSAGGTVVCAHCDAEVLIPRNILSRIPGAPRPARSLFDKALVPQHGGTSGYATASLVCALIGLFCGGLLLGIPAVVFGEIAKKEIARNPNVGGEKMAAAGRIIGVIDITFGTAMFIYWMSVV